MFSACAPARDCASPATRCRRPGFTLVEILVVISIIGILISITIPAVMHAKHAAARAQCGENLRQLALATTLFETTHGHMPGYLQKFGEFNGGVDPTDPSNYAGNVPRHVKVGGWPIALLGQLGNQPAYERWSLDRYPIIADNQSINAPTAEGYSPFAAVNFETFICPSASNYLTTRGINHYVANTGMHADSFPFTYTRPGSPARTVGFAKSQHHDNGIFNNQYAGFVGSAPTQLVATGKPFRIDDCDDGASQTMLLSENHQAGALYRTRLTNNTNHLTNIVNVNGKDVVEYPASSRYLQGAVWHFEDPNGFAGAPTPNAVHKINGGDVYLDLMTAANAPDLARPSSLHDGGVNMAMVDGSVRFVTESISYPIYQALLTPSGRSSDVPNNEFVPLDPI
ncbi:hypothetical protein Poly51_05330 [Rubripirellula tenax]|uniref:DUF1559 domain-containing protein n=1 Tax=Rubripirellula tenax TaxID=2528015 RepID=A0A5C6FFS0_9BACT|nr:DUF1559 domain-containing protein [Rubripirellula tenax]TWU60258.1 hypothetical protein Poly51_05330 [Rubripirellula tenax]